MALALCWQPRVKLSREISTSGVANGGRAKWRLPAESTAKLLGSLDLDGSARRLAPRGIQDENFLQRPKGARPSVLILSGIVNDGRGCRFSRGHGGWRKCYTKMVNRPVLEALGPEQILINVSRGSVNDEEALMHVLEEGKLGGAGLDVFASEPNVPEELKAMPNVVLQPHHSSGTIETRRRWANWSSRICSSFFRQTAPYTVKLLKKYQDMIACVIHGAKDLKLKIARNQDAGR